MMKFSEIILKDIANSLTILVVEALEITKKETPKNKLC